MYIVKPMPNRNLTKVRIQSLNIVGSNLDSADDVTTNLREYFGIISSIEAIPRHTFNLCLVI